MKWVRDPGISELIEYFDQPGIAPDPQRPYDTGWPRLARYSSELRVVESEIDKCRKDFVRTARNYFWIRDKARLDIPFKLWESQELIYEKICRLRDAGRPQKLLILKARQLGCSVLIEALIAWRTMFFPNMNSLIVSKTPAHSAYLFRIMTHIWERCPWWLKPMLRSHKIEDGLIFDNPDSEEAGIIQGLNSMIDVQSANQLTGVGEGMTINSCHLSEVAAWPEDSARSIIEGDLGWALADNKETIAIIETTAKGAGTYFHKLWNRNIELGEMEAGWMPVFLPWFFEKTRYRKPSPGWKMDTPEEEMRERIKAEWVVCDSCNYTREAYLRRVSLDGATCMDCGKGTMRPYTLSEDQLCWMWNQRINAQKDSESLKELRQEVCSTSEESFQISGIAVFPQEVFDYVNRTLCEPIWSGYLTRGGIFHGVDHKTGKCPCDGCGADHRFEELPLQVWEEPQPKYNYVIGVDVSEGLGGDADYSVCAVNKIGDLGEPDRIVAVFRSNTIDPVAFSYPIAFLGRWYNEAMLAVEVNKYDTTFSYTRFQLQYPNLYRWKHVDSTHPNTNKWGWETNARSKPRLWQTAKNWLMARRWILHSKNIYKELQHFQKEDYEERGGKASEGFYDDEIISSMIALYCSHDTDWDDNLGVIPVKKHSHDPGAYPWNMECTKCNYTWGTHNPQSSLICRNCGSPTIRGVRNEIPTFANLNQEWDEMTGGMDDAGVPLGSDYALL
jgi:hypothetical protein